LLPVFDSLLCVREKSYADRHQVTPGAVGARSRLRHTVRAEWLVAPDRAHRSAAGIPIRYGIRPWPIVLAASLVVLAVGASGVALFV
jgi:hypothetical protein